MIPRSDIDIERPQTMKEHLTRTMSPFVRGLGKKSIGAILLEG